MKHLRKAILVLSFLCVTFGIYLATHYSVPILMFHALDADRVNAYASISPQVFYRQMKFIKDLRYNVITLEAYCRLLREKKPVARNTVVITFDDAEKSVMAAVKILQEFDLPATIFVPAERIGMSEYMTHDQLKWMLTHTKVTIGSHTLTHPYLPSIKDEQLISEIAGSKQVLEKRYQTPIATIAYPTGGFDERALSIVGNAGYRCACTTNRGFSKELDLFALRRIKVTNKDSNIKLWFKLSGFYTVFKKPRKPY